MVVVGAGRPLSYRVAPANHAGTTNEDYASPWRSGLQDVPGAVTEFFTVQDTAMLNSVALGNGHIGDEGLVPFQGAIHPFGDLGYIPIPRAVWPDKPEPVRTLLIERLYGFR